MIESITVLVDLFAYRLCCDRLIAIEEMKMYDSAKISTIAYPFASAWRSLSTSRLMLFVLLFLGTTANVVYAHTPLVAFAAMSGGMLRRRRAIAVALLIWLINQSIGFGLRGYPLSATAFTWGALMGLGTLIVVVFASWRPAFARTTWVGHLLWLVLAVLVGFGFYQGLILLAYPVMADGHWMDWAIVVRLFVKQLVWAGGIALGHSLLLWRSLMSSPLPR